MSGVIKNLRARNLLSKFSELMDVKQKTAVHKLGAAKKAQGNQNK